MFKSNVVQLQGQQSFTTSLIVAEACDNRSHKNTLSLIRKYQAELEGLDKNHKVAFETRLNSQGSATEYALLTEDQASFLILLFRNTTKTVSFKLLLVKEFRKAKDEVNRLYANPPRKGILQDKRDTHHSMMDALISMRSEAGKTTEAHNFMCENKLCNSIVTGKVSKIDETTLSNEDAYLLGKVRQHNESFIDAGMDYAERKTKLLAFAMRYRTKLLNAN